VRIPAKAEARLPAREGIAAMQSINVVVINPAFLGVFLGTANSGEGGQPFRSEAGQ
jgi:uncharacterized membrane protein